MHAIRVRRFKRTQNSKGDGQLTDSPRRRVFIVCSSPGWENGNRQPSMQMNRLAHWLHRRIFLLLIAAYLAAAFFPGLGLEIRKVNFGNFAGSPTFTLPSLLLAFLLFNAGLGVKRSAA